MKKFATLFCLLSLFVFTFSACAAAATPAPGVMGAAPAAPPTISMPSTVLKSNSEGLPNLTAPSDSSNAPQSAANPGSNGGGIGGNAVEAKRIVIKNGTLSIVVKDPGASLDRIAKMAEQMGGFIVSSNIFKTTTSSGVEMPQAQISIRVPADKLTAAVEQIKAETPDPAKDVLTENITGSDVTKEYTDLQSRLTNLQNAADQLKAIMAKADKTEDVMSVYNQLMQVNEQIEVIKGQIKYYDEASNMSEIAVTLQSDRPFAEK